MTFLTANRHVPNIWSTSLVMRLHVVQLSIEHSKIKTAVNTLANHEGYGQVSAPIKSNFDWMKKRCDFLKPIVLLRNGKLVSFRRSTENCSVFRLLYKTSITQETT